MTHVPITLARNRRTGAFERFAAAAVAKHVSADAPIVVACSGGPDSLGTLVALARTRDVAIVTAAFFDHRFRAPAEIARERALVEAVATALGARFVAGHASSAPSDRSESAARDARYRWLARACAQAGATVCATGHHLDDQAETVLLRLVRGAGAGGAAGMASSSAWPVRTRGTAGLTLVRPLLDTPRADIEVYLDALGLRAAADPSNDTLDYARNRIRQRVVPELRKLNPRAADQIAAFARRSRADDDALNNWASETFATIAQSARESVSLERAALLDLPLAVGTRIARIAAAQLGIALDAAQAEATLHAARAQGRRVALGGGFAAWLEGDRLVIRSAPEDS